MAWSELSLTLLGDGLLALALAAVFARVGSLMLARPTSTDSDRLALRLFSVWWFGLAATTLVGGANSFLGAFEVRDVAIYAALSYVAVIPLTAALWGLLYYLVFIYTGRTRALVPLTGFYLVVLLVFLYLVSYLGPTGVDFHAWQVRLTYTHEVTGPLAGAVVALLLGPTILASLAYATLYFRLEDRSARYRVAVTSLAFFGWFGSAAFAAAVGWSRLEFWPLVSRLISLAATLAVLAAYQPPRFVRERFAVHPVREAATTKRPGGANERGAPAAVPMLAGAA